LSDKKNEIISCFALMSNKLESIGPVARLIFMVKIDVESALLSIKNSNML